MYAPLFASNSGLELELMDVGRDYYEGYGYYGMRRGAGSGCADDEDTCCGCMANTFFDVLLLSRYSIHQTGGV